MDIEITVWSVNATTLVEKVDTVQPVSDTSIVSTDQQRNIFDPALGAMASSAIVLRKDLKPGDCVVGPAAITEDETTIILPSSRRALRQLDGCIDVTQKD